MEVKPGDIVKASYGETRFICIRAGKSPGFGMEPILELYCIQSNHEYKVGSTYVFDIQSSWLEIEDSLVRS